MYYLHEHCNHSESLFIKLGDRYYRCYFCGKEFRCYHRPCSSSPERDLVIADG